MEEPGLMVEDRFPGRPVDVAALERNVDTDGTAGPEHDAGRGQVDLVGMRNEDRSRQDQQRVGDMPQSAREPINRHAHVAAPTALSRSVRRSTPGPATL